MASKQQLEFEERNRFLKMFLSFRDDLLLEAGFLAFVVAPLFSQSRPKKNSTSKSDVITMWLIRWLLFRVLFSTGISKLLSGTPKWWDLSGKIS